MIKTNVNYEIKIQDNPIEILKYIKIIMHKPERSKYPFTSMNEPLKRIVKTNQKYNESILDY